MMRCSHRQLTPYRVESQQLPSAHRAAKPLQKTTSVRCGKTTTNEKQERKENLSRSYMNDVRDESGTKKKAKGLSEDPPGRTVSSSPSSVSSTSATIDTLAPVKPTYHDASILPPPPPPPYCGSQWYASSHLRYSHPLAAANSRGMVLASPPPPRTPPTQGATRSLSAILSPPKVHRVTCKPSRTGSVYWTPYAVDPRFSDLQLQQQQQPQQQGPSEHYYPPYYCNPYSFPANLANQPDYEPHILSGYRCRPEVIGHPSLRIYKLRLPTEHMKLLDQIVEGCEEYARDRPGGWRTDLYSLTRQDIALIDVAGLTELAMPIMQYISRCICEVYHAEAVRVDRNQPHVLKYNQDHTGVELHHDRCDVTGNLMLSRSHTYCGGGTYFPDINKVIRLKYGEFLLHPGGLVHGGMDITKGTRYLLVLFAHLKK